MTRFGDVKRLVPALFVVLTACDRDTTSPNASDYGTIRISVLTSGEDKDADGYSVVVDYGIRHPVPPNGTVTLTTVPVGSRHLELEGVASNCTAGNGVWQDVTVSAAQSAVVDFTITCVTRNGGVPEYGTLQITTTTTGPEPDQDGYSALVVHLQSRTTVLLPAHGTMSFNVPAGTQYVIVVSGIAPNCRLMTTGSPDVVVDVTRGSITPVSLAVLCEPEYPARLQSGMQLAFARNGQIHLANSDGTGVVKLTDGPSDCEPAWSADGARLAFVRGCTGASRDIFVMNADGSNVARRTYGGYNATPSWSPDGTQISFAALGNGSSNIYVMPAIDDGEAATAIVTRPGWDADPAWSPDGSSIAYTSDWTAYDFTSDIFLVTPGGAGNSQITSGFAFWPNLVQYYQPAWSPDSKDLAVVECPQAWRTCDASGLAVMKADGSSIRRLAFTRGFARPSWAPDGKTIAFSNRGSISWIRSDASARGFIVVDGNDPAWRPPVAQIVR